MKYVGGKIEVVYIPLVTAHAGATVDIPVSDVTFVAISHVWADGLGNPSANKLPQCQLSRLQGLVDNMVPAHQRPMPFWIDTLFIPKIDKDSTTEDKEAKYAALHAIEW